MIWLRFNYVHYLSSSMYIITPHIENPILIKYWLNYYIPGKTDPIFCKFIYRCVEITFKSIEYQCINYIEIKLFKLFIWIVQCTRQIVIFQKKTLEYVYILIQMFTNISVYKWFTISLNIPHPKTLTQIIHLIIGLIKSYMKSMSKVYTESSSSIIQN